MLPTKWALQPIKWSMIPTNWSLQRVKWSLLSIVQALPFLESTVPSMVNSKSGKLQIILAKAPQQKKRHSCKWRFVLGHKLVLA